MGRNVHLRTDTILYLEESHFLQALAISHRTAPYSLCKSEERPACCIVDITQERETGKDGKDGFTVYTAETPCG